MLIGMPRGDALMRAAAAATAVAAFVIGATAQAVSPESAPVVTAIRFRTPGIPEPETALYRQVALIDTGVPLDPAAVGAALGRLYGLGGFESVRAWIDEGADGVVLTFELRPERRVRRVRFEGIETLDAGDLGRAARLRSGVVFDESTVAEEALRLRAYAAGHGWMEAEVMWRLEPSADVRLVDVVFRVREGPRMRLRTVRFVDEAGVPVSPAPDVRRVLDERDLRPGPAADATVLGDAARAARDALRAAGYWTAEVRRAADGPEVENALVQGRAAEQVAARRSGALARGELVLVVAPGPRYTLRIEGARRFGSRTIIDTAGFAERVDWPNRDEALRRIVRLYRRYGYADAGVEAVEVATAPGERVGVIRIAEGAVRTLAAVTFPGARAVSWGRLRAEVTAVVRDAFADVDTTLQAPLDGELAERPGWGATDTARRPRPPMSALYAPEAFRKVPDALADVYRAEGYDTVNVGRPGRAADARGGVVITIPIIEGPRFVVRSLSFRGRSSMSEERLARLVNTGPGRPFVRSAILDRVADVVRAYRAQGRLYAQASWEAVADGADVDLTLVIDEGPEVRVGNIRTAGNLTTRGAVIEGVLGFETGDVFDPQAAVLGERLLYRMNAFRSAAVTLADPERPAPLKDVIVRVDERLPGLLEVGGGLSTDRGIKGHIGLTYRNMGGVGLEGQLSGDLSHRIPILLDTRFREIYDGLRLEDRLERTVRAGLRYPVLYRVPFPVGASFTLQHVREQRRSFGIDNNGALFALDAALGNRWQLGFSTELAYKDLELTGIPFRADERVEQQGRFLEVSPRVSAAFTYLDDLVFPTLGVRAVAAAEYFNSLAGTVRNELGRFSGGVTGYLPLVRLKHPWVLKLVVRAGAIVSAERGLVPDDKRFKLGGRASLRGFAEQALFPADLSAQQVRDIIATGRASPGGEAFALVKAELRIPIIENSGIALFYDAANLWINARNFNLDLSRWRHAVGVGLRVGTPIGDIALDYGVNLSPVFAYGESRDQIHFSIGLY